MDRQDIPIKVVLPIIFPSFTSYLQLVEEIFLMNGRNTVDIVTEIELKTLDFYRLWTSKRLPLKWFLPFSKLKVSFGGGPQIPMYAFHIYLLRVFYGVDVFYIS